MNTAEIRARHYSNPTAIQVDGIPIPCCQSCWAPWPCDAIRLCDALDEARALLSRIASSAVRYDSRVYRLTDDFNTLAQWLTPEDIDAASARPSESDATELDRLRATVTEQTAEIQRLGATKGQCDAVDRLRADSQPQPSFGPTDQTRQT